MSEFSSMSEYLNQPNWWSNSDHKMVPISDMSFEDRARAARWLYQNATPLILLVEANLQENVYNREGDSTLADVLDLVATDPRKWIVNTPLHKALLPPVESGVDITHHVPSRSVG